MNRSLLPLALALATCTAPALADHTVSTVVPAGMQINMFVVGDVAQNSAHPGDTFRAQAASDVFVDGLVVVRKGAEGRGRIVKVKPASENASGLGLAFDWVYAADGTRIQLAAENQQSVSSRQIAQVVAPPSINAFGLAGFFGFIDAYAKDNVSVRPAQSSL